MMAADKSWMAKDLSQGLGPFDDVVVEAGCVPNYNRLFWELSDKLHSIR